MKILFLDHYGVMSLNGSEFTRTKDSLPTSIELKNQRKYGDFDYNAVKILNQIIEKTDTEIVVTSDWRIGYTLDYIQQFYSRQNVSKSPIDVTITSSNSFLTYQEQRSFEIKDWLNSRSYIEKWAAVDDLFLPDLENFVWAKKIHFGITEPTVYNEIIKLLL